MHARMVRAVRARKAVVVRRVKGGHRATAAIAHKVVVLVLKGMVAHRAGGHMAAAAIVRAIAEPRLGVTDQDN